MNKKIAFISQPEYFRFIYENDLDAIAYVKEFPFNFGMSADAFKDLEVYDADYNIFFRGEFFPEEVLTRLRGVKVCLSSEPFPRYIDRRLEYTFDSLERYLNFRAIGGKAFDYVFHYDEASLPFLSKDGLHLSGAFPFPVATKTYAPKSVDKADKEWDLFFVGRSTDHREKYFGQLKHHYNFLHIAHGVWGKALVEYLHKAKICLNVHAENEISWEPRMQMLLSAGAFVVSEKITPNPILRPNVDYVEITSPQELNEAVSYYLSNPIERTEIAESGCNRVRDILDSVNAFKAILQGIELGIFPEFSRSRGRTSIDLLQKLLNIRYSLRKILR